MPEIDTARLRLRPFKPDDLDGLARLFADAEVMRYIGVEPGRVLTRNETEAVLESFMDGWRRRGFGRWALVLKATEEMIGLCGLRMLEEMPELLYVLRREHWGAGLAVEAAHATLRFGFEELRFERIVAVTRPENLASRRVLEKLGMRYEQERELYGVVARAYALARADFHVNDFYYQLCRD